MTSSIPFVVFCVFISTTSLTTACHTHAFYKGVFVNSAAVEPPSFKMSDVPIVQCLTFCERLYGVDCMALFYETHNRLCSIYNSSFLCVTLSPQSDSIGFVKDRDPVKTMDKCFTWPLTAGTHPIILSSLTHKVHGHFDANGWLVIQRRVNGSESFDRSWAEYEDGFGALQSEFWLGNKYVHLLTNQKKQYEVEFGVEDTNGTREIIHYEKILLSGADDNYRLTLEGLTTSTSTDFMSYNNRRQFSTKDADNDLDDTRHCAQVFLGGWWYTQCSYGPLNALYDKSGIYINWPHFTRRLVRTDIKIRPIY